MRPIFFKILLCLILIGCSKPNANYIYDEENLFSEEQIEKLNQLIRKHEQKTSNEIAVVSTFDWKDKEDILHYSVDFFNNLGIGKGELNNGVLITLSPIQKQARITTGYGLENILTDSIAKQIIDSTMMPHFKKAEYFEGVYSGAEAIMEVLEKSENKLTD